jgi:hypothetical protein
MGTMSASDAAPLPRLGEVFFDVRGDSRTMRVSWYADTGVALFSIWQGDTCTGTFRLPIPELPRMVQALTQGPPDRAGSGSRTGGPGLPQADPRASTAAMGPGGMPVPVPGSDRDFPAQQGYGAAQAGYAATAPVGYQEGPPTARYSGTGPGGYQGPAPAGQHQTPTDGYYREPVPEGHRDLPPGAQARSAAGGYQDAGYQDAPREGYEGSGSAAPGGYENLPPGGYRNLPPGGGYRDVPPESDYRAPENGYRETPAAAPSQGPAQFAGRQQDPNPPTGPLSVGRWRSDEPSDGFPQARPGDGFVSDGYAPDGYAEDRAPADGFETDSYAPDGYAEDRAPAGRFETDSYAPDGYAEDRAPADGYGPDGYAEDRAPADGYETDRYAPDGYADEGFAQDEFTADSYQGEAEQGYLPSPATDMFPAASLSGNYPGQGSHRAGYEPDPAALDHESPCPAGGADRGGPRRDSGAYPGRGGAGEREYGHSRGRS